MLKENKKTARIAGVWYLAFILLCMFAVMFVDDKLLILGNAAATLSNISANKPLYFSGLAAFAAGYACFIMTAAALMKLFKPVESRLAKLMLMFVLAGTAMVSAGKAAELYAVCAQNIDVAARLFAFRNNIEMAAGIFWGLWLLPLGLLILKSDLIPKIIGILLLTACLAQLMDFVISFFLPFLSDAVMPAVYIVGMLGEFGLVLWLLIKGVKVCQKSRVT